MSTETPLVATSATDRSRQLEWSRGLSVTGRLIAAFGGALLISAIWTPWFFGLVGTAVVLSGVALLEYEGPYDDSPPTFSPTPHRPQTRRTELAPEREPLDVLPTAELFDPEGSERARVLSCAGGNSGEGEITTRYAAGSARR